MSYLLASLTKGANIGYVWDTQPSAGIPVGVAYFQVVYHNVEEEAEKLHREGDLYRQRIKQQLALKKEQETQS
ncbi:hypothetical protein TGRH88_040120 [Toxoplasma gondii]|uniref:Uncharacterized protein n=1 Tax=Toxoplasma gondii TaxID=5811 RepID=A0A7J6JZ24_TOXGO|nr:hypothetical protein TGRH88_040120 [Toxoplasma gondii]